MGPKSAKKEVEDTAWRTRIEEAVLDEDTWHLKVIMLETTGSNQDRMYLNKFESFAANENRFVIKCIDKSETIFMVNQLGADKKTKDEGLRVFEEGQSYLKDRKDIPPDILALIIKHLILKIKEEYLFIKKQKLEVMEGLRQESATMLDKEEVRGTVSVKPPVSVLPPPSAKGKGKGSQPSGALPEPEEGKKYNTVLRERGEEWRDRIYVDDFPVDGPNIYIAVSGFTNVDLPVHLMKIGIPLTAIVQIRIDPIKTQIPPSLIRTTKRGQSETDVNAEKSLKFWEDLQELRTKVETSDFFKNTAFIIFSPPYWESEELSGSSEKIYDELSYLMYDIQDLSRQQLHYLENMDILHIPQEDWDQRYYNHYYRHIDDLPLESVTIYSVLDTLLRTACKGDLDENSSFSLATSTISAHQQTNHKKSSDSKCDEKVQKAKSLVRGIFKSLCKTDADKKNYRVTYGEEYETYKDPTMIQYGDFVKNTTFHLKNINLDNIVGSTLFGMPLHKLWLRQEPPKEEIDIKISFHVNLLLSCFERDDVETAELIRLMHILACRKLYNNRSSLKRSHLRPTTLAEFKKVYLKRSIFAEPLKSPPIRENYGTRSPSFPSMTKSESIQSYVSPEDEEQRQSSESSPIKSLFYCPDISELVSAAEIANNQPISHIVDEFEYFEDFSGNCSYQILLDAFNKFNCVDYKYCEVTDNIIMMFFNSHDKDGIFREEWRVHIPTPVCLQDFFDFVLEEHYDWIESEERIYDASFLSKRQSTAQEIADAFGAMSCVDDMNVEVDLIMEGSLKHQEMIIEDEETAQTTSERDATTTGDSKKIIHSTSTLKDSKIKKLPPSSVQSTSKYKSTLQLDESDYEFKKPFLGYNLGDRRVEVFGKDAVYYSRDHTRISSLYTLFIPYNVEYIVLNVVPGEHNNEIWVHRAFGDFIKPEVLNRCESFRVNTKDNLMINIKKQLYQVPLPISSMSFVKRASASKNDIRMSKLKMSMHKMSELEMVPKFETKSFYSFSITWPNGLITESVHDDNCFDISHIKQYYLTPLPHLDEDMRCISLNGEVVIFKTSGDIQALCPDGTCILITKYGKSVVLPEIKLFHLIRSESKGKQKDQSKDKNKDKGKAKNEIPIEKELPKYELYIDEFEIIETNGLRQKWVCGDSYNIEKLTIRTATDYCIGEIFSTRMDGTNTLLNKDGIQVVTFPDKTRIISYFVIEDNEIYPEWTDEEKEFFDMLESLMDSKASFQKSSQSGSNISSEKIAEEEVNQKKRTDGYVSVQIMFTIEHENFTTVSINKANGDITVDSPNETSLNVDIYNRYNLELDDKTTANFDGEDLNIIYEACPECKSYTKCDIKIQQNMTPKASSSIDYNPYWVKVTDSFCKKVVVDNEGNINLLEEPCYNEPSVPGEETAIPEDTVESQDEVKVDWKSESSITSHGKCRDLYQAKKVRFIVMNRDISCSEIIHRSILEQYKKDCYWKPWCYMKQYDTFGDHRTLHSILTPISLTEAEKWLMNSKMCAKPSNLTYKDLKTDCGKGFYHWMRPYDRFEPKPTVPDPVHTHKLPRAFTLRTLEHQWCQEEREKLKGAKELLSAILRYRQLIDSESESMLHVPINDGRSERQRDTDRAVQAVARKIYYDLKERTEEDVQLRAKMTITTKPPLPPEELSVEGEFEEPMDPGKLLEEERASALKDVEEASKQSPKLERYWRRRAEELKEEEFYLFLLRESTVPRYFRNVFGGAIWWEIDHLTDEAVESVRRKKMKCVCADGGEGTSHGTSSMRVPYM